MVFVSGEAGIGKTTLVDAFAAQARGRTRYGMAAANAWTSAGHGEAYMPVLEALSRMCREQPERT